MLVSETSRFTVLIILAVITTVADQRRVAVSLLFTKVTYVDILIHHWIESATKVLVVTFTLALMARDRRRSCRLQAVACRRFRLKWSKLVTNMTLKGYYKIGYTNQWSYSIDFQSICIASCLKSCYVMLPFSMDQISASPEIRNSRGFRISEEPEVQSRGLSLKRLIQMTEA